MAHPPRFALPLFSLTLLFLASGCEIEHRGVRFDAPAGLLTEADAVEFSLRVPPMAKDAEISLRLDGEPIPRGDWQRSRRRFVTGVVHGAGVGRHELEARIELRFFKKMEVSFGARDSFEVVSLAAPELCDVLIGSEGPGDSRCLFPWPSSRYLEPARTPTGVRVALPREAMPRAVVLADDSLDGQEFTVQDAMATLGQLIAGAKLPIDPAPFNTHDGFSPTVQILMHFPGRVDLRASNAARLLATTRTFSLRSLEPDSPSVLLDADTGEWVPHFLENDVRATPAYQREQLFPGDFLDGQATILRPGKSLTPGHRYIVAMRGLKHPDGSDVQAEPVFAALRDGRPSDIPAVEERRKATARMLRRLRRAGVRGEDLILAFEFVVQSDEQLTGEMLSMREQAFAFLETRGSGGVRVDEIIEVNPGCQDPARAVWREIRGSFEVPLFLENDPYTQPGFPGKLLRDEHGVPVWETTTQAPFGAAIPCAALDGPSPPLVLGHGLFGTGAGTVSSLSSAEGLDGFDFVSAGTNWSGLSGPDLTLPDLDLSLPVDQLAEELAPFFASFVGQTLIDFDDFPAMGDRLRQGQLATLVLARMLSNGSLATLPAFQRPDGRPVIDPRETFYFGGSLGGIMGLMFGALTPDVNNLGIEVGAMNFSLLLQRATPFLPFELLLRLIDTDPNTHLLTLGLLHETWVHGEAAAYATHITRDPLPGSHAKNILMTVALYDQQVSNIASEIVGATLALPNLEGSVMPELPLLPSRPGPLPSAYVVTDTASFDVLDPAQRRLIPPLLNAQAQPNRCDPHGRRGFIPASIEQLLDFLRPGGTIRNTCTDDGLCNASEAFEIPFGESERCEPFPEP
ncbi:MAG: hypothetical protein ABFS46_10175 [Myxococcota bacterium]